MIVLQVLDLRLEDVNAKTTYTDDGRITVREGTGTTAIFTTVAVLFTLMKKNMCSKICFFIYVKLSEYCFIFFKTMKITFSFIVQSLLLLYLMVVKMACPECRNRSESEPGWVWPHQQYIH